MENCLFCKIVSGEIPSRIIYKDEHAVAFHDINPLAPVHILVIPRLHISTLNALQPEQKELTGHLLWVCKELARQTDIAEKGYRIISNCGSEGGQEIFHLHLHLLGGKPLGPLLSR